MHDSAVTTLRGSSIDQVSFAAILAEAQQGDGVLTEGPAETIDGSSVDVLRLLRTAPVADDAVTNEILDLSADSHLPVRILGYQGETLVRRIDFSNVVLKR